MPIISNDDSSDVSSSLFEDDDGSDDDCDDDIDKIEEYNRSFLILQKLSNRDNDEDDDFLNSDDEDENLLLAIGNDDDDEEEDVDEEEAVIPERKPLQQSNNNHQISNRNEGPKPTGNDKDNNYNDDDDYDNDDDIIDTLAKKPKEIKPKVQLPSITTISPDDTEEDVAMKALLSEWDVENNSNTVVSSSPQNDNDTQDDDDSSCTEVSERLVELNDGYLDHIVLAAPDLDEAMIQFENMTGVATKVFGAINGIGIRCARISFNDTSYLEIIAPDPKQPGPIGELIKEKGIKEMTPFAFAIRSSLTEQLKDDVLQFNYVPDHISMFGGGSTTKDGTPRKWEMLHLYNHNLGGICPYFVHWDTTQHPCTKLPIVGKLKKFTIRAPSNDPIHLLLQHVKVHDIHIEMGTPKMSFQFSSPEGTIKFATSKAVGYKFPGFDDDEHGLPQENSRKGDTKNDEEQQQQFTSNGSPESLELINIESYE